MLCMGAFEIKKHVLVLSGWDCFGNSSFDWVLPQRYLLCSFTINNQPVDFFHRETEDSPKDRLRVECYERVIDSPLQLQQPRNVYHTTMMYCALHEYLPSTRMELNNDVFGSCYLLHSFEFIQNATFGCLRSSHYRN
jgi:hypothetical protein